MPGRRGPPLPSEAVLKRLTALHPRAIDLSLGRIERLLAALDHPERRLPPVVHVAGTNGKGSVVALLRAMLEAAGYRVHTYISPHLVRFHERIRIAGQMISEPALVAALERCEAANAGQPITFFEITTAAAFVAFADTPADIALLETGLGGRLDATNVIARPMATVITPISLDHQQYLGSRLADIAGEKAGILKPGVPAVIAPQHAIATRVLGARAAALKAPMRRWGHDFRGMRRDDGALVYRDGSGRRVFPAPALPGAHQYANAAVAIATLGTLTGLPVPDDAIARGLATVDWPARMQRLGQGRLTAPLAAAGFEVWLDGGHNPQAARALTDVLAGWRAEAPARPVYLVAGMLQSKDAAGFLGPMIPALAGLWSVPIPGDHAGRTADEVAAIGRRLGATAEPCMSFEDAFAAIRRHAPGRVLVAGSLYLAGALLAAEETLPR